MKTNSENLDSNRSRLPKIAAVTLAIAFACWFGLAVYANRANSGVAAAITNTNQPRAHSGVLIEFTDGNDDNYMILDTHIGEGNTGRLNRSTGLGDSNTDSVFITMDVD